MSKTTKTNPRRRRHAPTKKDIERLVKELGSNASDAALSRTITAGAGTPYKKKCPVCGERNPRCEWTRPAKDGTNRRFRRCSACRSLIVTVEVVIEARTKDGTVILGGPDRDTGEEEVEPMILTNAD